MINRELQVYKKSWKSHRQMLHAGEIYDVCPRELQKQMLRNEKGKNPGIIRKLLAKTYHLIK